MVIARLLLALGLWLCGARAAEAHSPPEVRRLVFDADRQPQVLVANRGLIFRDGAALQLMCNEALSLSTSELPDVVQVDEGLLAATSLGLFVSRDRGCSWERQGSFDAARSLVETQDALWIAGSGIYLSVDGGRSWEQRWRAQDGDFLQDLLAAPGAVYALRSRVEAERAVYSVLLSKDAGQSWQEQALSLQDDEQPTLLSVDPREPARVIAKAARSDGSLRERLLVSRDGAQSFEAPLSLFAISAASWSEDGARAWVASEEGLYVSTDGGESFARVGPGELLSCVEERDGRVYACGFFAGFAAQLEGVGVSEDGGATFQSLALFREVHATLSCTADAETVRRCELPWQDWESEQGVPGMSVVDAGAPAPQDKPAKRASGCSVLSQPGGAGLGMLSAVGAALAFFGSRWRSRCGRPRRGGLRRRRWRLPRARWR